MEAIKIKNLNKFYGQKHVLKDISLTIGAGEVIGYIGPNGAGKSTTIKVICGMISEFEGEVDVLGMNVKENPVSIKKRIGYIPELINMYDVLTAREYLQFAGRLYGMEDEVIDRKGMELLHLFDLYDRADERMAAYSKGMKQKVLIISGLLHNPEIIFFDEPLSGLDANAVIMMKELLLQLKESGKTIFYSSHIMDVVEKISDRIIIIDQGTIIADGTVDMLKAQAHAGSLEHIFSALTGDHNNYATAKEFVDILRS